MMSTKSTDNLVIETLTLKFYSFTGGCKYYALYHNNKIVVYTTSLKTARMMYNDIKNANE